MTTKTKIPPQILAAQAESRARGVPNEDRKVKSLTQQQTESQDLYRRMGVERALRTDWDPDAATKAIVDCYLQVGKPAPEVTLFYCVEEASRYVAEKAGAGRWTPPHGGAGWVHHRYFYRFFHDWFGLAQEMEPSFRLDDAGAFWWWFFEGHAVIAAPPEFWRFDRGNLEGTEPYRLHCEDGPACQWRKSDGTVGARYYFWRGVAVPGAWIEGRAQLEPSGWRDIDNQELRRCYCEILGWHKILGSAGSEEVSRDDFGILYRIDNPDLGPPLQICLVEDPSTSRKYGLSVPLEATTPRGALAACAGVTVEDYYFDQET